jgi:hypothetical protein
MSKSKQIQATPAPVNSINVLEAMPQAAPAVQTAPVQVADAVKAAVMPLPQEVRVNDKAREILETANREMVAAVWTRDRIPKHIDPRGDEVLFRKCRNLWIRRRNGMKSHPTKGSPQFCHEKACLIQ